MLTKDKLEMMLKEERERVFSEQLANINSLEQRLREYIVNEDKAL